MYAVIRWRNLTKLKDGNREKIFESIRLSQTNLRLGSPVSFVPRNWELLQLTSNKRITKGCDETPAPMWAGGNYQGVWSHSSIRIVGQDSTKRKFYAPTKWWSERNKYFWTVFPNIGRKYGNIDRYGQETVSSLCYLGGTSGLRTALV